MNLTSGATGDWSKLAIPYTEQQISSVIQELGIDIQGETDSVFLCLCPFHRNTDTPSFAVNKENGTYICFSPACDEHGSFLNLVMRLNECGPFPARRLIDKFKDSEFSLKKHIDKIFEKKSALPEFPVDTMNRMADALWNSPAQEYMHDRGFSDKTLAYFQIGYSKKKNLVAVPMHDWEGKLVGVIGRTIEGKRFENSKKLPTKNTMFNIHRAKKCGERVVVVESSFDAMLIHQAGFPCVVATCGGWFTDSHQQLLDRYFNEIIIMTDNDDPNEHRTLLCKKCENTCLGHNPGRALGMKIANSLQHKRIRWASYDHGIIYPHGAKDAGDLTAEEIKQCIDNNVSMAMMHIWKKEFPALAVI